VLLATLLAAAAPSVVHVAADMKVARASLLTAAALGKGWTGKPAPQTGVMLACRGHSPSGAGIVETGAAASQSLSFGSTGPFLSQQTSVYRSATQANAYWRRAVTPELAVCVAQNVEALRAKGVKVTILSRRRLTLPSTVAHSTAFRVTARANKLTLYFDVLLLGNGRAITSIALSSFQQAPTAAVEQGLARIAARKLGGPGAA
jgi:hypothetical protein